jgi:hypothetical protein
VGRAQRIFVGIENERKYCLVRKKPFVPSTSTTKRRLEKDNLHPRVRARNRAST